MSHINKIIIITSEFPPGPGGIGNHAHNLSHFLVKRNYSVDVITLKRFDSKIEEYSKPVPGLKIIRINSRASRFKRYFLFIRTIYLSIRENQKVVILCSGRNPLIVGGILKLLFTKIKFILVAHGGLDVKPNNWLLRLIITNLIKNYDQIVSVSNFTAKCISRNISTNINIINNGINIDQIKNKINYKNTKVSKRKIENLSLITIGRISERKGQNNVIRALPSIIEKFPNTHYHIVGIPDQLDNVLLEIRFLSLENHCTIHGELSDKEMFDLLNTMDIFMFLSDQTEDGDFEGFGIAVIEANLLGIPAIGSKDSGISDAIVNNRTGFLVNQKDNEQIMDSIQSIMKDYNYFSQNAKQHALKYSWENVIDRYIDVFKQPKEKKLN